jgi:hypothetical protein
VLLQSAYPELHDAILHAPLAHAPVPWATVHALPHVPQFCGSDIRFVEHPLPEQLPMPGEQPE